MRIQFSRQREVASAFSPIILAVEGKCQKAGVERLPGKIERPFRFKDRSRG
jgi:hypothetical protein